MSAAKNSPARKRYWILDFKLTIPSKEASNCLLDGRGFTNIRAISGRFPAHLWLCIISPSKRGLSVSKALLNTD